MLEFRSFEIVSKILHFGSLNAAAASLAMTQPALTKALSSIETDIGAKLFFRTPTGMQPTQTAVVLLRRWGALQRELHDMRREIDRVHRIEEGVLRIATGLFAAPSVEVALGRLVRKFPSLRIATQQLSWFEITNAVRRADVDIGVADPEEANEDPLLDVAFLNERVSSFVCRKDHPILAHQVPRLEDILAYPFALNVIPARWAEYFPVNLEALGFQRLESGHLRPQIQIHSVSGIANVLLNSNAISVLPADMLSGIFSARNLVRIENFSAPWPNFLFSFITRKQAVKTPAMVAFFDEVRRVEEEQDRRS